MFGSSSRVAPRKDTGIVWDFDTISSVFFLLLFLGIVAGIFHLTRKGAAAAEQTKASLREKGVTIEGGQMRVQTTGVAPNREEYIARTQRAFERSAAKFAANPAALTFGLKDDVLGATSSVVQGISSVNPLNGKFGAGRGDSTRETGVNMDGSSTGVTETPAASKRQGGMGMFRRNPKTTVA